MIQVNNVTKSFGAQTLFEDISFIIGRNEKIGLIGRNGSGKSTLFKMILKEISYDSGEIKIPNNYKIAALEQHIHFTKATVLEECIQALGPDEQYDHYKAEKILFGLGFTDEDMGRAPSEFSGGYQIRINLTKCLLANPNLLLLDEPTNYLDIVSLRWLRKFLKNYQGEVIIITHDREFMDSVVTHIIGFNRKKLKKIEGTSKKYHEQLAMEDELFEQTRVKQEAKKKELQQFVDRFKAKASKAAQAQSRMKQLEKMGTMEKLATERSMGLKFQYEKCPGKTLMELNNLSFSYTGKAQDHLFEKINFKIDRKDRIGIIGKNGKGKSTLLNVIGEEFKPTVGSISHHPNLRRGHFGQTNIQRLNLKNNIIQEIVESNPTLTNTQVRQICGSMMFIGELAEKKVEVLSGGERSRVLLGKILAHKTNLLLLDEPTNHLDMESVEVLTSELKAYEGAVVLVTHNEMMLRKLVNKLIIFQNGGAEFFLGTYDEFIEKIGWEEEEQGSKKKKASTGKENRKEKAQTQAQKNKLLKPLKKEIRECEELITELENKLVKLNMNLITASETGNAPQIEEYSIEIARANRAIEQAFDQLEAKTSELEELESESS